MQSNLFLLLSVNSLFNKGIDRLTAPFRNFLVRKCCISFTRGHKTFKRLFNCHGIVHMGMYSIRKIQAAERFALVVFENDRRRIAIKNRSCRKFLAVIFNRFFQFSDDR